MTAYAPRSFMLSALLHGLVMAIVLFLLIPAKPPPLVPVITMSGFVLVPEGATSRLSIPPNPSISAVVFTPPAVPAHVQTTQAEETATDPATVPPVVRTPSTRRPAVVAPPASQHAPTRMTMEEFRKLHPSAATAPSVNHASLSKPARINLDEILPATGRGAATGSAPSASAIREADAYLSRLLAKLRASHEKPAGLEAGLRVRVEFSLRADGALAEVRLLESSGSREFDESVVAAFRKVADFGVPPKTFVLTNRVTFRTDAED